MSVHDRDFANVPDGAYLTIAQAARFLLELPQRSRNLGNQRDVLKAMNQMLRDANKRGEITFVIRGERKLVLCLELRAWALQHRNPSYRRALGLGARRLDVTVSVSGVSTNASVENVNVVAGAPGYPHDEILAYVDEIMALRQKLVRCEQRCAALEPDAVLGRRKREAGGANGRLAKGVRKPSRK